MNSHQSNELVKVLNLQTEILKRLKNNFNFVSKPEKDFYQEKFDGLDEQLIIFQKSLEP
ncbi:hypothetical protein [Gelidibacter salicanalis]|uniref:Uncharacterized protein n=1 Tax=Gelidibacter salicanalis TaxID=291193 RepID=A0A934KK10_9FLAO|nr:hypothetical protein [Gelidibacter salicanalis]MBJ7879199.1 hypothetical protein [Gelidibacter salicanalis]